MAGPGLALTRAHQLQQINNGAAGAALILEIGKLFIGGKLDSEGFITAVVGADLLTHEAAVRLAATYVAQFRVLVAPEVEHAAPVAPEFDPGPSAGRALFTTRELDRLRGDPVRDWAAEAKVILDRLAVTSDRVAKNAGRDTVMFSAAANGRRWRRVTDGNPCAFCAMLASRGPVYRTEASAGVAVGRESRRGTANYKATGQVSYGGTMTRGKRKGKDRRRGTRAPGEKFHDRCGCTVEEELVDWEPTAQERDFADLYDRAVKACAADGKKAEAKNVMSKMRELGAGVINDAHDPHDQ